MTDPLAPPPTPLSRLLWFCMNNKFVVLLLLGLSIASMIIDPLLKLGEVSGAGKEQMLQQLAFAVEEVMGWWIGADSGDPHLRYAQADPT